MIQTESLSVRYGARLVVREANLFVPAGQITAIVGPSGCGKTSFLMAINRMTELISGTNVSGRVLVDHCDIHAGDRSASELRRCVGMIFQRPNPFPMSIAKNIQLALKEHGQRNRNQLAAITQRVLEDVGLWDEVKDRLGQSALQLSGGQQQRLCIARALSLQPKVLLMDEPCSSLDPLASAKVESLIASLRGRYTIIIVTHNLAQARRLADQTAVFWLQEGAGEIIEEGPTERVFTNPKSPIAAAYLSGQQG